MNTKIIHSLQLHIHFYVILTFVDEFQVGISNRRRVAYNSQLANYIRIVE